MDNSIKFPMGQEVVTELKSLYEVFIKMYDPKKNDAHEQLLYEHIRDVNYKLEVLDHKLKAPGGCKTVKLQLTGSEAMAFCQIWQRVNLKKWPLANVLVCGMVGKIDKKNKNRG